MASSATPIPELEASTLDSERHDEKAGIYELLCHVVERGAVRRFRLRCEGVRQVRRRVERPRLEPWNYTEIREAYGEPIADGGTLVSLDLWNEAEWIEVDCRSTTVMEIGGSADHPEHPARITWSEGQQRFGLPGFVRTVDPAWVEGTEPVEDEGWSLVLPVRAAA